MVPAVRNTHYFVLGHNGRNPRMGILAVLGYLISIGAPFFLMLNLLFVCILNRTPSVKQVLILKFLKSLQDGD